MSDLTIDPNAAELELEPEYTAPIQVQETQVIFVPRKDFSARINQDTYHFSNQVPQRIPRTVANIMLEDPDRGYIKD